MPTTITADVSANLKILKALEEAGHIESHLVAIENHKTSSKIKNRLLPIAVYGSPFATYDNASYASVGTPGLRSKSL